MTTPTGEKADIVERMDKLAAAPLLAPELKAFFAGAASAAEEARVLAREVEALRKAQRDCTCGKCGKRDNPSAYLARLNTDTSAALDRYKGKK